MAIFHLPALCRCNGNGLSTQPAQRPSWASIAPTNGTTQRDMAAIWVYSNPQPQENVISICGVQNQVEFPYIDNQNGFWTLLTVEGCRTVSALGGLSFWDIWKQNDSSNTFGAPNAQQWTEIQVILVVECWVPQGLNNLRVSQGSLGHLPLHYKGTP